MTRWQGAVTECAPSYPLESSTSQTQTVSSTGQGQPGDGQSNWERRKRGQVLLTTPLCVVCECVVCMYVVCVCGVCECVLCAMCLCVLCVCAPHTFPSPMHVLDSIDAGQTRQSGGEDFHNDIKSSHLGHLQCHKWLLLRHGGSEGGLTRDTDAHTHIWPAQEVAQSSVQGLSIWMLSHRSSWTPLHAHEPSKLTLAY